MSAVPSWNAWGQASSDADELPAKKATLSPATRQQQTAAALARQKLLELYEKKGGAAAATVPKPVEAPAAQPVAAKAEQSAKPIATTPTKANPSGLNMNNNDWRRYHAAWQQYYQKYYGDYYGKAARQYVSQERMKYEREVAEREAQNIKEGKGIISSEPDNENKELQENFKEKIQQKVASRARKVRKSHHFVPILVGSIILLLGLAFQYNQVIVANVVAYMSPGGTEINDISAIDPTVSANLHEKPTLMIPKLNVEVPVVFGSKNDVNSMNNAMSNGVAHFAVSGASAKPGEIGNFVVSGHSAGNIYQNSNYKFIFSGLTRMGKGDLIYMDYNNQRYTYRVTGMKTVNPSDVAALRKITSDNAGKPMITLITCTPLGTSKYRLLVYGEQIYPDYGDAPEAPVVEPAEDEEEQTMPKNDDSPLEQFWKWLTGQN